MMVISLSLVMGACGTDNGYVEPMNNEAFRLSSINDVSNEEGVMSYKVYSPYTDTFEFTSSTVKKISIFKGNVLLGVGESELVLDLVKDEEYTLVIKSEVSDDFKVSVKHLIT